MRRDHKLASILALCVFSAALSLPLLLSEGASNYTWDETNYHLPAIRQIAEHWPRLDLLRDSLSATAPGYHYFLATASRLTGDSIWALRILNLFVSLSTLAALWLFWPAKPSLSGWSFTAAAAPLALSNFFVKSSAYVVTDNAALLLSALSLVSLLWVREANPLWSGLSAAAACFVRQSSLWLAAGSAVLTFLAAGRLVRVCAIISVGLPVSIVALLYWKWNGFVPPAWQADVMHRPDANPVASLAYLLSLCALLGSAYFFSLPGARRRLSLRPLFAAALLGAAIAGIGHTDYNYEAGRWGGYLWELSRFLPVIQGRSILFLLLAPAGAILVSQIVIVTWRHAPNGKAACWTAAFLGWTAVSLSSQLAFHRYYEPPLLLLLIAWLGLVTDHTAVEGKRLQLRPLLLLGSIQLLITLATAHGRTFHLY